MNTAIKPSLQIAIRNGTEADLPLIFNSWLKAYKHSSRFAQRITNEVYYKYHHAVIERILARGASVLVATPSDDSQTILGYLVAEQLDVPTLHFTYVKAPFRRFGIARQLLASYMLSVGTCQTAVFTHWTKDCDWATEQLTFLQYNPYLI